MNSKQRNYIKQQIEELKVNNWRLTAGQVGWGVLGIITLVTIVGPYFCYGYVKKYGVRKRANRLKIQELDGKITQIVSSQKT